MKSLSSLLWCLALVAPMSLLIVGCTVETVETDDGAVVEAIDDSPELEPQSSPCGSFCKFSRYDCFSCAYGVKGCEVYICGDPAFGNTYECKVCSGCGLYC